MYTYFIFRLINHIVVFVSSDKDVDLIPDTQDRRWKQLWSVYTGTVNVLIISTQKSQIMRKPVFGVSRFQGVQPQKMARILKFQIKEIER